MAPYNADLELTSLNDSFNAPLTFRDGARIPDSLRHSALGIVDHQVEESMCGELATDGVVFRCSIKGENIVRVENSDIGSSSKGRFPLF